MANWDIDPKGIETVSVVGAVVERTEGPEGSKIHITVPGSRGDWRESNRRGLYLLSLRNEGRSGRGNVTNVISGGTHTGMVIQAGNVGNLHIGADGAVSGLPDATPIIVKITAPPSVEVDYES